MGLTFDDPEASLSAPPSSPTLSEPSSPEEPPSEPTEDPLTQPNIISQSTEEQESEELEESTEEPMTQTSTEIVSRPIREIEAAPSREEMDLTTQLASLTQIIESRRRRREEMEESGPIIPLDIPSMRDGRRWPPGHRALVILLEGYGNFRPNNNLILESRFEDSGNNFNITRRTEEGFHTLTLRGPRLHILGRDRQALYILEVVQQLREFIGI